MIVSFHTTSDHSKPIQGHVRVNKLFTNDSYDRDHEMRKLYCVLKPEAKWVMVYEFNQNFPEPVD